MTPQEIAKEINTLKPDLTEFWNLIKQDKHLEILNLTNNTSVTLFILELFNIYIKIHPHVYADYRTEQKLKKYQENVNFNIMVIRYVNIDSILKDITQHPNLISAHVHNFKQYLNPYLYKKFGFTKSKAKSIAKLEENEFSLELFKNALGKRKIPSTEGIGYFNQIVNFEPELRDKFMDVIFEHCTPSITFAKRIAECTFNQYTSNKYISVSRDWVRNVAYGNRALGTCDTFNEQDSNYVPFICGVPRKPTLTIKEVSALFNIMSIILMTDHNQKQYIANCIKDHLALPEYNDIVSDYKATLERQTNIISNLLKEF